MLPQRQVTSSAPITRTWPRSPATPVAPRWRRPPEMMPEPMPVATLTSTRSSTSVRCTCCSPSAMMLTSLSTSTGTAYSRWRRPGTSYLSQPGMIGGLIGRPVACSTGPGRPMPIAARCLSGRRCAFSSDAHGRGHPAQHHLGALGHVEALAHLAEDLAREVGQRGAHVGGADVDADHDLGRGVEREQRRRASAGRARAAERRHQLQAHQYVDPGGDGRPGQAGGVGELGARPRSAVAQQLEDVARVHGRSEAPRAFGV